MNKMYIGLGILGGSAVVGAFGYFAKKVNGLLRKINMALSDLETASAADIQENLVEEGVRKAAERKTEKYCRDAERDIREDARKEIRERTKQAVEASFKEIESSVRTEVAAQVANLDHNALRKQVVEDAKKATLAKLDGSLDDILEGFSDDLNRVKKIHTSIADALSPDYEEKKNKGLTFTIGG